MCIQPEHIPSFLINSKKLRDPENAAVACNNTFLTLAEILNLHQVGKEDTLSWKFPWS